MHPGYGLVGSTGNAVSCSSIHFQFAAAMAAEAALASRNDPPDELWLVDTTINSEWTAWRLIRDGISLPDEDTQHRYWDFKPADLEAV
jgi:hypothetical protein